MLDRAHCPTCGQRLPERKPERKPPADELVAAEIMAVRNAIRNDPALTETVAFSDWANRRWNALTAYSFPFDA